MNIVYLVFGNNRDHYRQAYFSICTALAWKNDHDKIIILTEDPSLFNFFGNIAEIIPIDKNIIKEWEGKYQFFWRVKIKALQHIAEKYPLDSILYLDGDTFFYKDMQPIRDGLQNGQNYMPTAIKQGSMHWKKNCWLKMPNTKIGLVQKSLWLQQKTEKHCIFIVCRQILQA